MHACMRYVHTCIRLYIHTCNCPPFHNLHVCMYVSKRTHILDVCMCIRIHVCVHTCIYSMHGCIRDACMYIWIHFEAYVVVFSPNLVFLDVCVSVICYNFCRFPNLLFILYYIYTYTCMCVCTNRNFYFLSCTYTQCLSTFFCDKSDYDIHTYTYMHAYIYQEYNTYMHFWY